MNKYRMKAPDQWQPTLARRYWALPVMLVLLAHPAASAARLHPKTVEAFENYIRQKEERLADRLDEGNRFLWAEESKKRLERLKKGDVVVRAQNGKGEIDVPDGLIHDWFGAVFIPGVTLEETLAMVQDYDHHKSFYESEVLASKLLEQDGDRYKVQLRLRKTKIVTVILDTEHDVRYGRLGGRRAYSRSYSTLIRQLKNAGKPDETLLPAGRDDGFLWRLYSYWRFQAAPDGVYMESEIVALTRGVPFGLGWLIKPIIRSLPKQSLEKTLEETRAIILERSGLRISQALAETRGETRGE